MNFKLTSKSVKKNSLINGIIIIGMLFSQVSSVYAQNGSTETPTISSTEEVTITPKPTSETTVVMTEEPTSEPTATSSIETLTPTATAETPTVDLSTPTLTAVPTDVSAPTSVQSELEEFSWTLTINISKEQADALASLEYNVISDLQGHGVTVEFDDVQLRLYGSADLEQLRQVAYGDLSPIVDYLGGGVALNIYMPVTAGGLVNVSLESRLSTGYIWAGQFDDTSVFTEKSDASFDQQYPGSGSPTIQTMHLQATEDGAGHIHLLYQRSWESSPIVSTINIYLQEMTPTIDLSNPSGMKCTSISSLG
jgi:predicted secreted protein